MLVITREVGEWVQIGDNIRVMLTEVRGGSVKLGIDAPKEVRIVRAEVAEREAAEQT